MIFCIFYLLGTILGSFICCQVKRAFLKTRPSRSFCFSCQKPLKWFDNIPVFSWILLRGKCRYCQAKIGRIELFSELGLGVIFAFLSQKFLSFPSLLVILLIATCFFWYLFLYDLQYQKLSLLPMFILIFLAILFRFSMFYFDYPSLSYLKSTPLTFLGSIAILPALYFLLYFFSKEKWVGGGDWILCLSIIIFLGRAELALSVLFLSNLLATIFSLPLLTARKNQSSASIQIPFGPYLISAFLIVLYFSNILIRLYLF